MANGLQNDFMLKAELSQYLYTPNTSVQLTDKEVLSLDLIELRRRLSELGCSDAVKAKIAARRRMLKSREYAQGARDRHHEIIDKMTEEKKQLVAERDFLKQQVDFYKSEL